MSYPDQAEGLVNMDRKEANLQLNENETAFWNDEKRLSTNPGIWLYILSKQKLGRVCPNVETEFHFTAKNLSYNIMKMKDYIFHMSTDLIFDKVGQNVCRNLLFPQSRKIQPF